MKKILSLFLAFGCIGSLLVSCSSTPEVSVTTDTPSQTESRTSETETPSDEGNAWSLEGFENAPDATPAKDPADGVKVRYLCSPASAGTINGTATQYIQKGGYSESVTAMPFFGYSFKGWSDGCTDRTRRPDKVTTETSYTAIFEEITDTKELTIPDIFLTTASGKPVSSKTYTGALISISGANKANYNLDGVSLQVKGRGNSTWGSAYIGKTLGEERWSSTKRRYEAVTLTELYSAKNSYTLKFDESVNLLGIGNGKNRDWILQANKFDITMLRNKVIYLLAEKMNTFGWVTHCTWVNLYVNGEYRGVYMIQEKVEAAKDRIAIDDGGSDPDKDYLVELDFRVDKDTTKKEGIDYFKVPEFHKDDSNAREFDIVSDHGTKEECDFIRNFFIEVDTAIRTKDKAKIEKLVDLHSMVDMFIIEELVKDCDWGATSLYMCRKKEDNKLYFVSPWDYDLTIGSYSSSLTLTNIISHGSSGNEWFEQVHNTPWFIEMVRARMNNLEDDFAKSLDEMYSYALGLEEAANTNNDLWQIYGVNYHEYVSPQVSGLLFTYKEHVGFIHDWLLYRWAEIRKYYPNYTKSSFE